MFEIITKRIEEGKSGLKSVENELFIGVITILVGFLGFGIGKLSSVLDKGDKGPVVVRRAPHELLPEQATRSSVVQDPAAELLTASVVASKNGKRYYYAWCSGASRLSPKTKITFTTKEAAEKAGYTIASGCAPR